MKSGFNFAINQEMVDNFKNVLMEVCDALNKEGTNMRFDSILSLPLNDSPESPDLVNWTLSGLNFTNLSFDYN